ncbi:MAG: hypothetical protein Kow0056_13180 [Coriobacteriia bacterium]
MQTLKSRKDIASLFREGSRSGRKHVVALARLRDDTDEDQESCGSSRGRLLVVAGRKLGGSVMRNRAKRVLRASFARTKPDIADCDVALIATQLTARADSRDLDSDVREAVREAVRKERARR